MRTIERKLNNASIFGGSDVTMILHYRNGALAPFRAEVFASNKEPDHSAVIGLWWDGKELVEYDGIFFFPTELEKWLEELGYSLKTYLDFCRNVHGRTIYDI